MDNKLTIEITYGNSIRQLCQTVSCPPGTSVASLLDQAKLEQLWPGLIWQEHVLGIFSKRVSPDAILDSNCRIEIYRPLLLDPKQARLNRALKNPLK